MKQQDTSRQLSVWYYRVKPPLWKNRCLQWWLSCVAWIPKEEHLLSPKKLLTWSFRLIVAYEISWGRGLLVFPLHGHLFGLWIMMMDPCFILCNNLEKKFSGFALSMSKFSSLNYWRHAFCSGVNIRGTHRELTLDIIRTEWMILETVPAEMPSSWAITLHLKKRSCKIMSSTLTHFLWRCFQWLTWTWIFFSWFPDPLKLLGPKLYLV